jgi:acyl CoA:acetate/3-ketoacid CoA transferase alpha subunit
MEKNIITATVTPATVLTQGQCVQLNGDICGAGEYVYGIVKRPNSAADEPCEIVVYGECYALVDGDSVDVAVGNLLKCDASGNLVKATTTGTLTDTGTAGASITIEEAHIVALEANAGAATLKRVYIK